jgi:2-keto-4-pentenoate hydratase/2-oxohepta-3-ene-1,7-dioic acid hydratase in catechol pathway
VKLARIALDDGAEIIASVSDDGLRPVADYSAAAMLAALQGPSVPNREPPLPLDQFRLLCPAPAPATLRDFMVFEDHVANARQRSGRDVPKVWYEEAIFYFSNTASIFGPEDPITAPAGCRALDLELEVACLVGVEASDVDPDDPASLSVIAGLMLMNDWSARDLQMREMAGGLGPAKGKDFATSLGPWLVTVDELGHDGSGRLSGALEAFINGRRMGGADLSSAYYTWPQILARASANTRLVPGDVIGSGTVGTGCLLELRELGRRDTNPWLQPGDVVELRGGPLGTLRNTIGSRQT